ncbi:E3 ubiquitin protein ligase RING1-like protein [Tanacetum coccineum]
MASELEREAAALAAMLHHFFNMTRPEPETETETLPDQILLFNMRTQSFLVIGGEKEDGEPPASKAAIEKMPTKEIKSRDEIEKMCERTGTECVICMEDWGVGDVVKEMPCQHKFHGGCVEKWLKIHATCPVCRCKMVEEDEKKSGGESDNDEIRREVWVAFGGGD